MVKPYRPGRSHSSNGSVRPEFDQFDGLIVRQPQLNQLVALRQVREDRDMRDAGPKRSCPCLWVHFSNIASGENVTSNQDAVAGEVHATARAIHPAIGKPRRMRDKFQMTRGRFPHHPDSRRLCLHQHELRVRETRAYPRRQAVWTKTAGRAFHFLRAAQMSWGERDADQWSFLAGSGPSMEGQLEKRVCIASIAMSHDDSGPGLR